jgi:hypothetical protein
MTPITHGVYETGGFATRGSGVSRAKCASFFRFDMLSIAPQMTREWYSQSVLNQKSATLNSGLSLDDYHDPMIDSDSILAFQVVLMILIS